MVQPLGPDAAGSASPLGVLALASGPRSIEVAPGGTEVRLAVVQAPGAEFGAQAVGEGATVRGQIVLHGVRGTNDATPLAVSLRWSDLSDPSGRESFVGTVALYGLRRASAGIRANGLTCHLDIPPALVLRLVAAPRAGVTWGVWLQPRGPGSSGGGLSIARVDVVVERWADRPKA